MENQQSTLETLPRRAGQVCQQRCMIHFSKRDKNSLNLVKAISRFTIKFNLHPNKQYARFYIVKPLLSSYLKLERIVFKDKSTIHKIQTQAKHCQNCEIQEGERVAAVCLLLSVPVRGCSRKIGERGITKPTLHCLLTLFHPSLLRTFGFSAISTYSAK